MNSNYKKAVEYEFGVDKKRNYQEAFKFYKLALFEGYIEARSKVKYKNFSILQLIMVVLSLVLGIVLDSISDFPYIGMFIIAITNIIVSIYYKNKYWYKTGFANVFNLTILLVMGLILLPISVIYPYLTGITWIPVVAVFTVAFFASFATLIIFLTDKSKNVLHFFIISTVVLFVTSVSFVIDTQDKRFSFIKDDEGIVITGYRSTDKNLIIPNTLSGYPVVRIAANAFRNVNLETIILNDNLKYIENYAFAGNSLIKNIVIPDGVILGNGVFADNINLESVTLPSDLKIITHQLFFNNLKLASINIPESVNYIGNQAFKSSGLLNIKLPEKLEFLGNEALSSTRISNLELPETLTYLGSLNNMPYLQNFNIPNAITSLPSNFLSYNTMIEEFVVPINVTSIGGYAFAHSKIGNVVFHNNITYLGEGLFYQNNAISDVLLPTKIKEIPAYMFAHSTVSSINVSANIRSIGNAAFLNARSLASITFEEGLVEIGVEAFANNINVDTVILPDSVVTIGVGAFKGMTNLKTVRLPINLKQISQALFLDTINLEEIIIPNQVSKIGVNAFRNNNLKTLTLPTDLLEIGDGAFYGNQLLTTINFNEKLEKIGVYTFGNTISLTELNLPSSLLLINDNAFNGSISLSKAHINGYVNFVGSGAFKTNNFTKIYVESLLMIDGWSASWNPNSLEVIVVG